MWTTVLFCAAVSSTFASASKTWQLMWSDEFDGTALGNAWTAKDNETTIDPLGRNEVQLFLASAVSVSGGFLHVHTKSQTTVGPGGALFGYTSGWVDTASGPNQFSQKQGRFEANMSLPPSAANGIWPGFTLLPKSTQCWPTGGEVDVVEFNGDPIDDLVFSNYHWAQPGKCGKDKSPFIGNKTKPANAAADWQTDFHVYAVEWFPSHLDFYLDSTLYYTVSGSTAVLPSAAMFIIFNQQIDVDFNPPKPNDPAYGGAGVELRVDWVRVYQ